MKVYTTGQTTENNVTYGQSECLTENNVSDCHESDESDGQSERWQRSVWPSLSLFCITCFVNIGYVKSLKIA